MVCYFQKFSQTCIAEIKNPCLGGEKALGSGVSVVLLLAPFLPRCSVSWQSLFCAPFPPYKSHYFAVGQ